MSQPRSPAALWIVLIALMVVGATALMFLATTFLFAFSGGQYRMVAIVGAGALAMAVATLLAAAIAWRLRGGATATVVAAVTTLGGWVATVFIEWRLSFALGAGG